MTEPPAVVTVATPARARHLARQRAALTEVAGPVRHVVVECADSERLPVAAARNEGVRRAGECEFLVLLDVDCLPGPDLVTGYRAALAAAPGAVVSGPVTYAGEATREDDWRRVAALRDPHPARPTVGALAPGATAPFAPGETGLFWSLSAALTPATWARIDGFDEGYLGYGGEDTDFAHRARATGVDLVWTGSPHVVHQWHPAGSPPWRHLPAIVANANRFHARWGTWPMSGWLAAFADAGAIEWGPERSEPVATLGGAQPPQPPARQ